MHYLLLFIFCFVFFLVAAKGNLSSVFVFVAEKREEATVVACNAVAMRIWGRGENDDDDKSREYDILIQSTAMKLLTCAHRHPFS